MRRGRAGLKLKLRLGRFGSCEPNRARPAKAQVRAARLVRTELAQLTVALWEATIVGIGIGIGSIGIAPHSQWSMVVELEKQRTYHRVCSLDCLLAL